MTGYISSNPILTARRLCLKRGLDKGRFKPARSLVLQNNCRIQML
ncbi:hypothetical protein Z950_1260 [Sulfitobacter mediterraneus KCTC 32188]|nr:hypothetical protein Z950_1260 [Sulfitobacter mediterraneus KCTC 32188]